MKFLDDERLSYKAKGILTAMHLEGKEEFTYFELSKMSTDKIDSILSGLRELKKYGYIIEDKTLKYGQGFIYVIGDHYGNYKIGKTKDVLKRINSFKTAMPYEPIIINVKQFDDYHNKEKELHNKYNDKRINREWFKLDDEDLKELSDL